MDAAVGFFVAGGVTLLLCLGVLAWVFLRRRSIATEGEIAQAENIAAGKERLAQLESQVATGQLSEAEANEYRLEIEAQLVADTQHQAGASLTRRKDLTGWVLASCVIVIATPLLYAQFGSPYLLLPVEVRSATLLQQLATDDFDLASNQDAEAQLLVAANLVEEQQFAQAADIYANIREIVGDNPQVLSAQLNALIMADADLDVVLADALAVAPDNPFFTWIAGINARENNDLEAAKKYWQRTAAVLPPESEQRQQVLDAINELAVVAEVSGVTVAIELAPELVDEVSDDDVLFLFARATNGPPTPLAAQKLTVGQLPVRIVLTDAMAMLPQYQLSMFDKYTVVARIAKGGTPTPTSGDLFGEAHATPGAKITIIINQITP